MSEEPDDPLDLTLPSEFSTAPAWAKALARQARAHRHDTSHNFTVVQKDIRDLKATCDALSAKLGEEPNSDGEGGRGLIGDLRKTTREVGSLKSLKTMGIGAIAAITFLGALVVLGIRSWIADIAGGA